MLALIGIISTLWLGATGRLELYIHPRYVFFTLVMALIGGILAGAGLILTPALHDDHDHETADHDSQRDGGRLRAFGSLLVVATAIVGLLMLPPSTLTSATANQRDLNSSGTLSLHQTNQLIGADGTTFDVRDWASLLRYDSELDYLTGKTATITGFVVMDKHNPTEIFYVARFLTTCCTVDAQPVGVPVYHPGWQETYKTDTWVTVSGTFRRNPDTTSKTPTIVIPEIITPTDQPARPYLH